MSKGLEALKNIKREAGTPYFSTLYDIDMWKEDLTTIEKELKALEIISNYAKIYGESLVPLGKIEIEHIYLNMKKYVCDKNEDFDLLKEVLL